MGKSLIKLDPPEQRLAVYIPALLVSKQREMFVHWWCHRPIEFVASKYNYTIIVDTCKCKSVCGFSCTIIMFNCHHVCRGSQVVVVVKLEREDEEEGSPHVIAPFFPQVSSYTIMILLCVTERQ